MAPSIALDYGKGAAEAMLYPRLDSVDAAEHVALLRRAESRIVPTADQRTLIIVACCYIVAIVILWNVPYLKYVIYPFKLLTVAMHEFSHAFVGLLTGAKIESIELEPNEGGVTRMRGGKPALTLPAGYLGSSFIGAAMIATSFDIRAAKVMTIVIGVFFLMTAWWARKNWLTLVVLAVMAGIIVAAWFIASGIALQYVVLFLGVMSCLYATWDVIDDLVARKVASSDASVFAERYGGDSRCWGLFWFVLSLIFFAAGVIIGIVAFKDTQDEQRAANFLNTR